MLDFFKTAAGSYNYVLMCTVLVWFSSTGVIIANFYKHRNDTVTAQESAKRAQKEKGAEEQRRIEAEKRLAAAELEIEELKPKPLPYRLRELLKKIDPKILEGLRQGNTQFQGPLPPFLFTELQGLANEDAESKYIKLTVEPMIGFGDAGTFNSVKFELKPSLLDATQK